MEESNVVGQRTIEACGMEVSRFFNRVSIGDDCWEWLGAKDRHGYGKLGRMGITLSAHRTAWELLVGNIPCGKWVLHKCDNRKCVRPDHLFLGDHDINMRDMRTKGKWGGPRQMVLTENAVIEIRKLRASGAKLKAIADQYRISIAVASKAITGYSWNHVARV